jgi:hypothetical protein
VELVTEGQTQQFLKGPAANCALIEQSGAAMSFWTYIRDVPSSNHARDAGELYRGFPQSLQQIAAVVPRLHLGRFLPILE